MKEITVLITGSGTATCQSVIKGLRSQGELNIRVITADMNPDNAGHYLGDVFYKIPPASSTEFIPRLLDICKREQVRLLIPIIDYEFAKLSAAKNDFEKIECTVTISSQEVIKVTTDKWLTFQFFRKINIPTPETFLVEQINPLKRFPVLIKPRILGRASVNVHKVETQAQYDNLIKTMSNGLIQEYKTGEEFTIDTLSDFNGKCIGAVVRKRVETKSGVSYKGVTVKDDELLNMAVRIVEALPIKGPANVQCFRKGKDISFFEVNPRFSGALVLSIASGFNSPLYLTKLALGENLNSTTWDYKTGVSMFRYWDEVFTDDHGSRMSSLTSK